MNKRVTAIPLYKCRRCGATVEGARDKVETANPMSLLGNKPEEGAVYRTLAHECGDSKPEALVFGICDLIATRYEGRPFPPDA